MTATATCSCDGAGNGAAICQVHRLIERQRACAKITHMRGKRSQQPPGKGGLRAGLLQAPRQLCKQARSLQQPLLAAAR